MKKYIIIFLLMVILAVPVQGWAADIQVIVNGNPVEFTDAKPMLQNGITLIPLRFISEKLGAEVEWDGETQKIIITQGVKKIEMQAGVKKALIEGQEVLFDQGPILVNNRTLVPLRFVSEALGANVEWDGDTRTVKITTESIPQKDKEQTNQITIKEFEGQPFKPSDLPTINGITLYKSDKPGAKIMNATINDLPIKIGDYIVYSIEIDDKDIKVKQYSDYKSPIDLRMVENGKICRQRNFLDDMPSKEFTYKYPIVYGGDDWQTDKYIPNKTDISKISHFTFMAIDGSNNPEGEFRLLVIENPLYKGGNN